MQQIRRNLPREAGAVACGRTHDRGQPPAAHRPFRRHRLPRGAVNQKCDTGKTDHGILE
jgi:hypothetical protein